MEFKASTAPDDLTPLIKDYPGFGELVTGSNSQLKVIVTALCMLNNPLVNQYFLDNQLKLKDRITGTDIFPREGMSLLGDQVYQAKATQEKK